MKGDKTSLLKYGLIAFLFYSVAIFITYHFFGSHNAAFSTSYLVSYVLFLILLILIGWNFKQKNNGDVGFKDIFKVMFVSILMGELGFSLMQLLYVKVINPDFFTHLHDNTKIWMDKNSSWSTEQKTTQLEAIKQQKNVGFGKLIYTFAQSLIKDSIFALIFIFIIKKPTIQKPVR